MTSRVEVPDPGSSMAAGPSPPERRQQSLKQAVVLTRLVTESPGGLLHTGHWHLTAQELLTQRSWGGS